MTKTTLLLGVLALVLSACAADRRPSGALPLPDDPATVILEVTDEGGFVPVELLLGRPPRYALTAGGTLYFQGPIPEIYPGPLLPNIQTTGIDPRTVDVVLQLVEDMGLHEVEGRITNDEAINFIADASTTVVTYFDQAGEHAYAVYALGIDERVTDARVALLQELVATLDQAAFSGTPTIEFEAERVEVHAGVAEISSDPAVRNVRPWPLPEPFDQLPPAEFGWRCTAYEGEVARRLLAELGQANQATTWDIEGTEYTIVARPLLPHETACEPSA